MNIFQVSKMATIGRRIRHIRRLRGLTQKALGIKAGFKETTADSRIAQYESDKRTPSEKDLIAIGKALGVNYQILGNPRFLFSSDIMRILFLLEEMHGLQVVKKRGKMYLEFPETVGNTINEELLKWYEEGQKLRKSQITLEDYIFWRYQYPMSTDELNMVYGSNPTDSNTSGEDDDKN